MSSFFQFFPTIDYTFFAENGATAQKITQKVTDIFRNVDVDDLAVDGALAYQLYTIVDGDRPDTVSQKLYGTPDYHWTFFVVNNTLKNGLHDWPLSSSQMVKFLETFYDSYEVLQTRMTFSSNEYTIELEEEQTTTQSYSEIENTFRGLDLEQDFIRVVSDGKEFPIKYVSELEQLWIYGTGFSANSFYFTTVGSSEQITAWRKHYTDWVQKNRPGFYRSNEITEGSVESVVYDMSSQLFYDSGRNAPHHYEASDGSYVSYYDVVKGTIPNTLITHEEYLRIINDRRSQINVVHPIYIQEFAKEFRKKLTD